MPQAYTCILISITITLIVQAGLAFLAGDRAWCTLFVLASGIGYLILHIIMPTLSLWSGSGFVVSIQYSLDGCCCYFLGDIEYDRHEGSCPLNN